MRSVSCFRFTLPALVAGFGGGCGSVTITVPDPPPMTEAVLAPETTPQSDAPSVKASADDMREQLLTPAPPVKFTDSGGYRYTMRLAESRTAVEAAGVQAPPGEVYIQAKVEVTNDTPDRDAVPGWLSQVKFLVAGTDCETPSDWSGLCERIAVTVGDEDGEPGSELLNTGDFQLSPGGSRSLWVELGSSSEDEVPVGDLDLILASGVADGLEFSSPRVDGDTATGVRRLNTDGPRLL